jgi:SMP-30/gluconolaconase/LRE-like protein
MKKTWAAACLLASAVAFGAYAKDIPGPRVVNVERFATLPDGVRFPEGIAANPATGDIFVGTFDNGPNPNKLVRFAHNGQVSAVKDFGGTPLLGLEFNGGNVYILNFGASALQRIPGDFDANTPVQTIATFPGIGAPAPRTVPNPDGSSDTITFGSNRFPAPNAMVFTSSGDAYVSDSFQGAIFKIANATTCSAPCAVTLVSHDPQLATAGFPPFGANGLALSADEKTLFIANTGDNRVVQMDVATAVVSPFAESVHGADGLVFDNGLLWVCANQGDVVIALNAQGRPVVRAGSFEGVDGNGRPIGLLFPASSVPVNGVMFVTNLALALTPAVGDEPEEDVTRWTVSRFNIPR